MPLFVAGGGTSGVGIGRAGKRVMTCIVHGGRGGDHVAVVVGVIRKSGVHRGARVYGSRGFRSAAGEEAAMTMTGVRFRIRVGHGWLHFLLVRAAVGSRGECEGRVACVG